MTHVGSSYLMRCTDKIQSCLHELGLTAKTSGVKPQYVKNLVNSAFHMATQMVAGKLLALCAERSSFTSYGLPVVAGMSIAASLKHLYDDIVSGKATGLSLSASIGLIATESAATAWSLATRGFSDPRAGAEQFGAFVYAFTRDTINYFIRLKNETPSPPGVGSTLASAFSYTTVMELLGYIASKPGELADSPSAKAVINFISGVVASTLTEAFDNVHYPSLAGWFNGDSTKLECVVREKECISAESYIQHMGSVFPGRLSLLSSYNEIMHALKALPDGILKAAGTLTIFMLYTMFTGTFLTQSEAKSKAPNVETPPNSSETA